MTDQTPPPGESFAARTRREAQEELQRIAEAKTALSAELEALTARMGWLDTEFETAQGVIMALDAARDRAREQDTAERESEDRRVLPASVRDRMLELIDTPFTIEGMCQRLAGEEPTLLVIPEEVEDIVDHLLGTGTVMDVSRAFEGSEDGLKTYIRAGVAPSADMPGIRTPVALDDEEPPADEDQRGDDDAAAQDDEPETNGNGNLKPHQRARLEKIRTVAAHYRPGDTFGAGDAATLLDMTPQGAKLLLSVMVRDGLLIEQPRDHARAPLTFERTEAEVSPEYVPSASPGVRGRAASGDGEPGAVAERKSPVQLTFEQVRDWVQTNCRNSGKFAASTVAEAMGCSAGTATRYLNLMADKGTIVKHGTVGRFVRYEFVRARDAAIPSPTHAPRSQGPHGPRPMTPPSRNGSREAVPYTGKPKGRTGKPGRDKKLAAAGFRVRDKKR